MPKNKTPGKSSIKNKRRKNTRPNSLFTFLSSLKATKSDRLLSQCKEIADNSNWKLESLLEKPSEEGEQGIRPLLNKEASAAFKANKPKLCIRLINAYFSHYSNNLQAELLKAEANYSLNKKDEALTGLKKLSSQKKSKYRNKASTLSKKIIADKATELLKNKSPEDAIVFYAKKLLSLGITPTYNENLREILQQIESPIEISAYTELQRHELNLRFSNQLITILEKKANKKFF